MPNICYSSETYHLDPQDLFILKDSSLSDEVNVSDEVVLLIGHNPIWIEVHRHARYSAKRTRRAGKGRCRQSSLCAGANCLYSQNQPF